MQFGLDIDTEMKNLNEHLKQNTPSSGESDTSESETELKSTKKIPKDMKAWLLKWCKEEEDYIKRI